LKQFIEKPLAAGHKDEQIALIKKQYDWDNIADETLKVYRKAFKRGNMPESPAI
jgi:hypothetical protein